MFGVGFEAQGDFQVELVVNNAFKFPDDMLGAHEPRAFGELSVRATSFTVKAR